jgi:hypothetical protein
MWQDRNIHLLRQAPPGRYRLDWREGHLDLDTGRRRLLLDSLVRVYRLGRSLDPAGRHELTGVLARTVGLELPAAPPPLYAPMSWEQVHRLRDEGCDFGSHTLGHAILTTMPPEAARREVEESAQVLAARLERPVDLFAYPNGDFDAATREMVTAAGYAGAVATVPGFWSAAGDRFAVPRIAAPSADAGWLADRLWSYWKTYGAPGPRAAAGED